MIKWPTLDIRLILSILVVQIYDDEEAHTMRMTGKPLDIDLLRVHTDPFYNECRAYGRIDDQVRMERSWFAATDT